MDEINNLRTHYARLIEDGQRIEAFANMPEWNWYVEHVAQPTIDENIDKIMRGKVATEKEEWVLRGIVIGLRMLIEGTQGFKDNANRAKQNAKKLEEDIKNEL